MTLTCMPCLFCYTYLQDIRNKKEKREWYDMPVRGGRAMQKIIKDKLKEIEEKENVTILMAVESGAGHGDLHRRTVITMCVLSM